MKVSQATLYAWLAARSIGRALPAPVADHGGYRVDTHSSAETCRWVFARAEPGLERLARSVDSPRHFLKLCGTSDELRAALPNIWQLHPLSYFMTACDAPIERAPPAGYQVETDRRGATISVRICDAEGSLAASGYAAETDDAFIYDRIETMPAHRRQGLGGAMMAALCRAKRNPATAELLVATEDGRALYETLGWRVLSPYATASIPEI